MGRSSSGVWVHIGEQRLAPDSIGTHSCNSSFLYIDSLPNKSQGFTLDGVDMATLWLLSTILVWPDLSIRLVVTPAHRQWGKRFFSPNDDRSESRPVVVVRLQYNTALRLHTKAPYYTGLTLLLSPKVGCFWQAMPVEDQPWRPLRAQPSEPTISSPASRSISMSIPTFDPSSWL